LGAITAGRMSTCEIVTISSFSYPLDGGSYIFGPGFPRCPSHFVTKVAKSDIEINTVSAAGAA
jgi:hypothetical protein